MQVWPKSNLLYSGSDKWFKGLDQIDRVPKVLWTEVRDIVQVTAIKTIPKKKKCKKAKWLSEEGFQIAENRREAKGKGKDESEKVGLKFNIHKTKIMASGPITSGEIDGETGKTVSDFIFWGSKITADGDSSHEIKRRLSLEGKLWPT